MASRGNRMQAKWQADKKQDDNKFDETANRQDGKLTKCPVGKVS